MNVLGNGTMVFIDPSSEYYYEDSIPEGVCIGYYIHGKGDLCEDLSGKDIHPRKLCLSLRRL